VVGQTKSRRRGAAELVRRRVECGGERLWRFEDFGGLPVAAVAQALSRMARGGQLERLSKGVYYRPRQTRFGKSRPNPAAIRGLATRRLGARRTCFPAGVAAANLLGFTTQNPVRAELATSGLSLPRKLVGADAIIHARRPEAWARLGQADAALLDFLRRGGRTSELSLVETLGRVLKLLSESGRLERLLKVADTEPPRVRALLGALTEHLGSTDQRIGGLRGRIDKLRASLNPLSRFDFGLLAGLPNARAWHAKERREAGRKERRPKKSEGASLT